MSIYLEYNGNDEWLLLTPCSSCETYVGPHSDPHEDPHDPTSSDSGDSSQLPTQLVIIFPNLVDRISIPMEDVATFVDGYLDPSPQITVTHLLIYLHLRNLDSAVTCINNLKLLHTGKQYRVMNVRDLQAPLPPLDEIAARFPIFQLFISPHLTSPAITLDIGKMLAKTAEVLDPADLEPATTYAKAMIKSFKRMRLKRLLAKSLVTRRSSRVLTTSLHGSSTDVEDNDPLVKGGLRLSWRKCFHRAPPAHVSV